MIEFLKKIIKCHIQGKHKISVISGTCVRCQYNRNEYDSIARIP